MYAIETEQEELQRDHKMTDARQEEEAKRRLGDGGAEGEGCESAAHVAV